MPGKNSVIQKIDKNNLCLGCGLCESVCGEENVSMAYGTDGFIHPVVKNRDKAKEEIISRICPGRNVVNDIPFNKSESIWGKIIGIYSTYSTQEEIRNLGSSGGTISGLAIYFLENQLVDAVLQVGSDVNDYTRNILQVSKNKKDVLACASSRYAPALVFNKILNTLESSEDTYCFIGKPCDISALKNFLTEYPQYRSRFKLTIAIMCAGIPSILGTEAAIDQFKPIRPITELKYRGGGWPGNFSFKDKKDDLHKMSYNDSWGKILGRHVHYRCKICPDGIGLQADLVVGDAWETKDGYPDFSEKEGQSLTIVRTEQGQHFLQNAFDDRVIVERKIKKTQVAKMQPFQYTRRMRVGVRIVAFTLIKRSLLNFKQLHILNNTFKEKPMVLAKDFLGSVKRLLAKGKY